MGIAKTRGNYQGRIIFDLKRSFSTRLIPIVVLETLQPDFPTNHCEITTFDTNASDSLFFQRILHDQQDSSDFNVFPLHHRRSFRSRYRYQAQYARVSSGQGKTRLHQRSVHEILRGEHRGRKRGFFGPGHRTSKQYRHAGEPLYR
jgi:hypothetical protein